MSVLNDTGAEIGANLVVMDDPSTEGGIKLPTGIDAAIKGVTLRAIPDGEWGDIVVASGSTVPLKYAGNVTKGDRLMPQTDGRVAAFSVSAGSNASLCALANESGVANDIKEAQFTAPGVSRQG